MILDSFTKRIIDNPSEILKTLKTSDIIFLKNQLFLTKEGVLKKYGKFEVDSDGAPLFTSEQLFKRMPDSTKKMFWSINNASVLIESLLNLNTDLEEEVKRMRFELSKLQIEYSKLQIELNK